VIVGKLVKMSCPTSFRLRGYGLVTKISHYDDITRLPKRVYVQWQKLVGERNCGVIHLEVVSENR